MVPRSERAVEAAAVEAQRLVAAFHSFRLARYADETLVQRLETDPNCRAGLNSTPEFVYTRDTHRND